MFENFRSTGLGWNDFKNLGTTFYNAGSSAISTIATPVKAAGNYASNWLNTSSFTSTPAQYTNVGDWTNQYQFAMRTNNETEKQRLISQLDKQGMRYDGVANKIYQGDNVLDNNAIVAQTGGGFNWGHTLQNVGNLLGAGLSGWDLYQNISTYGDRKALLKETKENVKLKNQQLRADMENMAKERARLDTMRSNAVAQRSGSSSISGW